MRLALDTVHRLLMKRSSIALLFFSMLMLVTGSAQTTPTKSQENQQVAVLVKELQAQQVAITENQAKIEAKLAAIAEAVRVARIYSSRGGR